MQQMVALPFRSPIITEEVRIPSALRIPGLRILAVGAIDTPRVTVVASDAGNGHLPLPDRGAAQP